MVARARADIEPTVEQLRKSAADYLLSARLLFNNDGPTSGSAGFLHRAMLQYTMAYLKEKGATIPDGSDIAVIFNGASKIDRRFAEFRDFGREITQRRMEHNYPGLAPKPATREKMRQMVETGERVIGMVKEVK
jgi:HEPN domain-containing protein